MRCCTNILTRLKSEWVTILVIILMWINMIYMHYIVYIKDFAINVDNGRFRPLYFALFDVLFILVICSIISLNRKKFALLISSLVVSIISISNIIYSRVFGQYIILDVLSELSNFKGSWWLSYVGQVTEWSDVAILLCCIISILSIIIYIHPQEKISTLKTLLLLFLSFALFVGSFLRKEDFSLFKKEDLKRMELYIEYDAAFHRELICNQKPIVCRNGIVRTILLDYMLCNNGSLHLTKDDILRIDNYWQNRDHQSVMSSVPNLGSPNVLFIIVESYLSVSANMKSADNKEITPNINRLINSSHSFSNLKIRSNKGGGQSSDAQIAYFLGLLPIKNHHAILNVINNECFAIPNLLKEQKGYNTYMSVPTMASFWHQIEANNKYGIDSIFAYGTQVNDFWCQDKELFENLILDVDKLREPYFHAVLTLSMHAPYYEDTLDANLSYPSDLSKEYCTYLNKCNYTDSQIGAYLDALATLGKLDNTIIVIAADHEPDVKQLNMSQNYFGQLFLPLIIYFPAQIDISFYQGPANQVDVFPTMMDLLGLSGRWRGIGHSLLNLDYLELEEEDGIISDQMILGDYFRRSSVDWHK